MAETGAVVHVGASVFLEWLFRVLPPFIAKRFISPEKLATKIDIELTRHSPASVQQSANVAVAFPELILSFEILNRSPIDIELERMLIDVWIGPMILRGAILKRQMVKHGQRSDSGEVYFWTPLTTNQMEVVKVSREGNLLPAIQVKVLAYFDTKLGRVKVGKDIHHEGVPVRVPLS